jgi:hypothetical protein
VYQNILLEPDRGLEQILREHTRRGWFAAQPKMSEGIGYLVVSLEDMMKLETIEFFLSPPYSCRYVAIWELQHFDSPIT